MRNILHVTIGLLLSTSSVVVAQTAAPSTSIDPNLVASPDDTQQTVMDKLQKDGYADITNLQKDDDGGWHGSAKKGGTSVEVYLSNVSKLTGFAVK